MKGIILAGGLGTRLFPITKVISKQLLPVYDKPMIYYPISILFQAKIKEILIISTSKHIDRYKSLLGNGKRFGVSIEYEVQKEPNGIAEALVIGENFIQNDSVCLILGDNVFYHPDMPAFLQEAESKRDGSVVFTYKVENPSDFGIIELDEANNIVSIEEKPAKPKSHLAIPGLYFFDNAASGIAQKISLSPRGEKEITSVLQEYLNRKRLVAIELKETKWFDTGTPEGLLEASRFISEMQHKNKSILACIEEIAWRNGWIDDDTLTGLKEDDKNSEYGKYILSLPNI